MVRIFLVLENPQSQAVVDFCCLMACLEKIVIKLFRRFPFTDLQLVLNKQLAQ